MGTELSRAVMLELENSTLKELFSDEKFVGTLREALPLLDDDVKSNLRELLARNPAERPAKNRAKDLARNSAKRRRISASPLVQHAIAGTSQEATVAGPDTTTSGAVTTLSPLSGVASLGDEARTRPLWEIKEEEVTLPLEIVELFLGWKADPSKFLQSNSSKVPLSLKEHYDYALSVRTSTISNKILWRFITTVYYDVISARSRSQRFSVTKEAAEFAVAAICKSPLYDREVVETNIINWAKDGARYRALANMLGGLWCYFFYPPNLSEWIWTKHLTQNSYDKAAKLLIEFGIVKKAQESGAVELARSIENILKTPFQSAVPTSLLGQWIMPISPSQTTNNAEDLEPCDTTLSSFQGYSFVSTPSTPSTTESLQSRALNHTNYKAYEQSTGLISTARLPAALFANNEYSNRNDIQYSGYSKLLRSPSPTQALSVSEKLFHYTDIYFKISCENMIFDNHGTLLNVNGAELHNDLCNEFDSYCFTATMLKGRELHVGCRRALSKASALVEKILRAEHPRTLACFLEVFIHFIQTGNPELTLSLRHFIKEMSAHVNRQGGPWGHICRLLGELDSDSASLVQAMTQIWECTIDIFVGKFGELSRFAVSVRLDYIKRVYGCANNLGEEERLLRRLLAQLSGGDPRVPTPRVMLNLAHNLNRQGHHDKAGEMAQEVLSLLEKHEIYAERMVERIECMKIDSYSQYKQKNTQKAEETIREAIKMILDQWGTQHPWVLEFKIVLEGWLREWGQKEDANIVRGEIEQLMGKDEIH